MEPITDIHYFTKKLKSQIEYLENAEDLGNGWLKIVKKARNPRSRVELLLSLRNRDIILEFDRDYGAIRRLRPPRRVKYLEVLPRIAHELQLDIYNFLLRKAGYETENYAYLLFYMPKEVDKAGEFIFNSELIKMTTSIQNAERAIAKALQLLSGKLPGISEDCQYCKWGGVEGVG